MSVTGAARALSHPIRLLILNHLLDEGALVSANLVSRLHRELSVADVDYHLKELVRFAVARRHQQQMHLVESRRAEWIYDLEGAAAGRVRDALDVFQGRKGIAGGKGRDLLTFQADEEELLLLAGLLTDPLRVRTILALSRRRGDLLSPVEAASMFGKPVSAVAYPFARLRDKGVAEIRETRPRRGAVEHLHALGGPRATASVALLGILAGKVQVVDISTGRITGGDEEESRSALAV